METVDVKTRKQKARALAQKGETKKALAVYREILEHLEGTKGILRELPLYVKAGDLCFMEGDTKAALAMYDKAGQLYAEHGSGKSVIAVCGKILKVLPKGINTHLHYARLLIEGGHVGEARKVLVNYAAVFDFAKVRQALEIMEGRSDDDVMPVLEIVLEMAEWSGEEPEARSESPEIAELEEQAEEAEIESAGLDSLDPVDMEPEVAQPEIAQPGDHEEEKADPGEELEISKGMADMLEERPVARRSGISSDVASELEKSGDQDDEAKSPADSGSVIVKSGGDWEAEVSSIAAGEELPEEEPTAPARAEIPVADIPAPAAVRDPTSLPNVHLAPPEEPPKLVTVEDRAVWDVQVEELSVDRFSEGHPQVDVSSGKADPGSPAKPVKPITPGPAPVRPSGSARVATPRPRPSSSHRRASGSRRAPGHRGRGKPGGSQKPGGLPAVAWLIIAVVVGVALAMLVPFGGRRPAAVADSSAEGSAAVVQGVRSTPTTPAQFPPVDSILDSTDIQLGPVPTGLDSVPLDVLGATDSVLGPPPADFPVGPAEPAKVPRIRVEGLVVETARTLITPGRTGYRLVQILDSGERLTLTIFPIAGDAVATMTEGAVQVIGNADGTAEGVVRFGDYEVRARAAISTELLKVLLEQLVAGEGAGGTGAPSN
ncbi:MAG: hypothetical protein IIA55_00920 [Gemmatimonadetes bacterium]|nr:hypothetical protein [Gemmatimonadota bacterium]